MSSSARRALRILDVVGEADRPVGVTELARQLKIPPGTAFRGLDALQRGGFVARYQSSSRYVLGPAATGLRQTVFSQFRIRDAVLPTLRQLASGIGETASLIVPLGWYGLRIASVPGSNEVTDVPPLGSVGPLGRTFAGAAILARLPPQELAAYQQWEQKRQPSTDVAARLPGIRAKGFAQGTSAAEGLAVAVSDGARPLAAIAIEGPLPNDAGEATAALLQAAAAVDAAVAVRPAAYANPFGHLDPESIDLGRSYP